ncbi:MAG: DUF3368 domain-containing protein [Ignavibacteriales bacterium]|nr:DUF3368 domain-containing protein [Ignavibacteriales bacterium]
MIVVSDTSPIANLLLVNKIELLEQLFEKVIIPHKFFSEIIALEQFNIDLTHFKSYKWIEVNSIHNQLLFDSLSEQLDEGEAEAIVLAKELHTQFLLIDEMKGRTIAEQLGIKTVGLLGVLIQAKEKGLIQNVKPLLDDLLNKARFWISKDLYRDVLKTVKE